MRFLAAIFLAMVIFSSSSFAWTHVGTNIRGWATNTVTFGVNTTGCPLSDAEVFSIIDQAINSWNGVPSTNLKVARATSTTTVASFLARTATDVPVILCDTNFSNEIGSDVDVVPAATFNTAINASGNIVYSGVLLNAQSGAGAEISGLSNGQVALTLAHEMGHALGLGHSSQAEALMYFSLGTKSLPLLTEDDVMGITILYPRNEMKGGALGCSSVHSPSGLQPSNLFSYLMGIMLCLAAIMCSGRILIKSERPL